MDVVYPLGMGSAWRNNEIRYSIRSLFKYADGQFDKIFIIGVKPKFLDCCDRLIHIPFTETQAKEVNIWEKVLTAATDERVSDEFFFMNDDHFFLNNFVMAEFPHFHRGDLKEFSWSNTSPTQIPGGYNRKCKRTLDFLVKHGLSTWHFDIHTPKRVEKQKFIDTYNFVKPQLYKHEGFILFSCYGNYNKLEPTLKQDIKLRGQDIKGLVAGEYNTELLFSLSNSVNTRKLSNFMTTAYTKKSPFEND